MLCKVLKSSLLQWSKWRLVDVNVFPASLYIGWWDKVSLKDRKADWPKDKNTDRQKDNNTTSVFENMIMDCFCPNTLIKELVKLSERKKIERTKM